MQRTTIFASEETLFALRAIAREQGISLASIIRKALEEFVVRHQSSKPSLSIIGMGRSGRRDVAERSEELLLQALRPPVRK